MTLYSSREQCVRKALAINSEHAARHTHQTLKIHSERWRADLGVLKCLDIERVLLYMSIRWIGATRAHISERRWVETCVSSQLMKSGLHIMLTAEYVRVYVEEESYCVP
jgi:hypothetical protein